MKIPQNQLESSKVQLQTPLYIYVFNRNPNLKAILFLISKNLKPFSKEDNIQREVYHTHELRKCYLPKNTTLKKEKC